MRYLLCALVLVLAVYTVHSENCEDSSSLVRDCVETTCATGLHVDCYSHTCTCFGNGCHSDSECETSHSTQPCRYHHTHWKCSQSHGRCYCSRH